ncbi:uncharacterized protein LOC126581806 [Anopheles aquasalis]|uniref:uncharacterized protein LOC126581806 n=1 Tax=Anopheles aquasalis TaxID=42839 RepID=UPI00215A1522|nr:uncharacterized protein LOC126581806 [Anopheles aquasalis]
MNKQNKKEMLCPRIWKRNEILSLLKLLEAKSYRKDKHVLNEKPLFWKTISATLKAEGIDASPEHCQRKWLLLYKAYTANPTQQSTFFEIIDQILNVQRNDTASEEDDEEQTISIDDMECVASPGNTAEKYETIEVVAESAPVHSESAETGGESKLKNSMDGLQALCRKIEILTELQRQQGEQIREILSMQAGALELLLAIKNRLH